MSIGYNLYLSAQVPMRLLYVAGFAAVGNAHELNLFEHSDSGICAVMRHHKMDATESPDYVNFTTRTTIGFLVDDDRDANAQLAEAVLVSSATIRPVADLEFESSEGILLYDHDYVILQWNDDDASIDGTFAASLPDSVWRERFRVATINYRAEDDNAF